MTSSLPADSLRSGAADIRPVSRISQVDRQLQRAASANDLGRFSAALALATPLIATDPENAHLWCVIAQAHLGLYCFDEALQAATHAASLAPEDPWPALLASLSCADGPGPEDLELRWAEESVRRAPHSEVTHRRLGYALLWLGRRDDARASAEHCLRLDPCAPEAHVLRVRVALLDASPQVARSHLLHALALDPDLAEAHRLLAYSAFGRDRLTDGRQLGEAAGALARVVRRHPSHQPARALLDLTLRDGVRRTAAFLCLDVVVARAILHGTDDLWARLVPLVLLALPAFVALRFWRQLDPSLRAHVWQLVRGRRLGPPALLSTASVLCLAGGVLGPVSMRHPALYAGLLLGLACLVQFDSESRPIQRVLDPGVPPLVRSRVLYALLLPMIALAGLTLWAAPNAPNRGPAYAVAAVFVAMPLGVTYWLVARRLGWTPAWWSRVQASGLLRVGVAGVLVCAASAWLWSVASGGGERTGFDPARGEHEIARELSTRTGITSRVRCPGDMAKRVGTVFLCSVTGPTGTSAVEVTLGRNGDYIWHPR